MERNIRLNWPRIVAEAVRRRKEQGLTQEQLAALASVSKPTLNRFEKGSPSLRLENALRILRTLGLD